MLIWHIEAVIYNTETRAFETKNFTVQARSSDEAETIAYVNLSQQGIPLQAVCSLVCSVN